MNRWRIEVALYLAITFGITWSIAVVVLGFPDWFVSRFGALSSTSPFFYVAVWAPNVAALTLTITRGGWPALKDLFSRLFRWRVAPWVWVAAFGFYPVLMIIVQIGGLAFYGRPLASADVWLSAASGIFNLPALLLGPLGEELGWRGYLLPHILERLSPAAAALVVGAIWMVWHIPAFLVSGLPQSSMAFPVFVAAGVALSVFVTWLFVNSRQSILIAGIVPHAIVNAYGGATGPMTWINAAVLVAGAVLLVVIFGRRLAPIRH
ncbi:MAG: CPBP family glutamic-type intramembrane protease [Gammaproteobacteria bacterium]